ncbi:MAG: hypothetical protein IJ155_01115 [Prevotella sp.]|nr:hypothetical protein [Prevotella sp.]
MMRIGRPLLALLCMVFTCPSITCGQVNNAFNSSRQKVGGKTSVFNQNRVNNFNDYRLNLNTQYERITRNKWKDIGVSEAIPLPDRDDKPVKPIRISQDDINKNRDQKGKQIDFGDVKKPVQNDTRPNPIAPVQEVPDNNPEYMSFKYLGTAMQVRAPRYTKLKLAGVSENAVADGWKQLSGSEYNNMLVDCMKLRNEQQLCDWSYLMMLRAVGDAYAGKGTNESTLLMAFLFSQSGYKIRLGQDNGKLEMLYASKHTLYNQPYYNYNGEKFFTVGKASNSIKISAASFPKEQSMSLWVTNVPKCDYTASAARTLNSERYSDMSIQSEVNKNLLAFYDSYPTSEVGGNFMTRWAMYANTPMTAKTRDKLYPQLKKAIAGKSPKEAVERLLNWVQTAFVYEYDDKVWGGDRAFFPEETLYYPYCDCEDRSILMSRLVRDLLGLKCILIYYPGHLAMAVNFPENVNGDYILLQGKKYTITDPTYIGAPVGMTMPGMDNNKATVILLD